MRLNRSHFGRYLFRNLAAPVTSFLISLLNMATGLVNYCTLKLGNNFSKTGNYVITVTVKFFFWFR